MASAAGPAAGYGCGTMSRRRHRDAHPNPILPVFFTVFGMLMAFVWMFTTGWLNLLGLFGTIAAVTDDQFSVEVSPGVFIRIVHAAVARVVEPAAPAAVDSAAPAASDEPPVD